MPHLPVIQSKSFLFLVQKFGFELLRTKGSHYILKHPDGRVITVPVHRNEPIPKGLLRKIIREDLKLGLEEFLLLLEKYSK